MSKLRLSIDNWSGAMETLDIPEGSVGKCVITFILHSSFYMEDQLKHNICSSFYTYSYSQQQQYSQTNIN